MKSQPLNIAKLNEHYPLMSYSSVYWPHHVHASDAIEEEDLASAVVSMLKTSLALTWISVNFAIGEYSSIIQAVDVLGESVTKGIKCSRDLHDSVGCWKQDIRDLAQEIVGLVEQYEGELKEGQRHGRGICIYEIGDRYEGDWENGKRHGFGILTFINGNRHEGHWKSDKQHGKGIWTFSDGVSYSGNWIEGIGQPEGVWRFPDGSSRIHIKYSDGSDRERLPNLAYVNYKGTCTIPRHDAIGKFEEGTEPPVWVYPNGTRYLGGWNDGLENGYGDWVCVCGSEYHGYWKDGHEHGKGTWITRTGKRFTGTWKEGWEDGFGVMTYPPGHVIEEHRGYWKNGRIHGAGQIKFANGNQYKGIWYEGKLRGTATVNFGDEWRRRVDIAKH